MVSVPGSAVMKSLTVWAMGEHARLSSRRLHRCQALQGMHDQQV